MQVEFHPPTSGAEPEAPLLDPKKFRFALQSMAGRILGDRYPRIGRCCRHLVGSQAAIVIGDNGAYMGGVETCGSVWSCPVCAGKIAEGRRQEVERCLDAHDQTGGDVFMAAFTMPHQYADSCSELRAMVSGTWKKLIAGKAWVNAKQRWGVIGLIRALEVTHGKNGWHPHLHVLFLTSHLSDDQQAEFHFWLRDRWIALLEKNTDQVRDDKTRAAMFTRAVDFRKADNTKTAGGYVAKWGVDSELTKANVKFSKKGGRSPWQLIADAMNGDHHARMLFREYALGFKGARQLTWSKGLRDVYNIEPELSDYELAKRDAFQNGDAVIGVLRRGLWVRVVTRNLLADVLTAAEIAGWSGVLKLLRDNALALPGEVPPDDDPR